jgi:hypothetical protein
VSTKHAGGHTDLELSLAANLQSKIDLVHISLIVPSSRLFQSTSEKRFHITQDAYYRLLPKSSTGTALPSTYIK